MVCRRLSGAGAQPATAPLPVRASSGHSRVGPGTQGPPRGFISPRCGRLFCVARLRSAVGIRHSPSEPTRVAAIGASCRACRSRRARSDSHLKYPSFRQPPGVAALPQTLMLPADNDWRLHGNSFRSSFSHSCVGARTVRGLSECGGGALRLVHERSCACSCAERPRDATPASVPSGSQ